jgi:hypothetical protein
VIFITENATWRKFFQQHFRLKKVHPSTINWQKDGEACWLYGPIVKVKNDISLADIEKTAPSKRKKLLKRKSDPYGMLQNLNTDWSRGKFDTKPCPNILSPAGVGGICF